MVTPHGEPWEVVKDKVLGVYDTDGHFQFGIELQYGNITKEELERMVLCFNACTGIPDSVLETGGIWRQGYNVGIAHERAGIAIEPEELFKEGNDNG